ncbi:MAG: YhfC family intramembrane metalloprotease, partial [Oscillospiraceae bacterium]|nr:YhfC family intramembrane metalloprotease [Oscillospiraceae bacterium]
MALAVLFPAALWIFFKARGKRVGLAVLAGGAGFFVPQMLIRIPILQLLASNQAWASFVAGSPLLSGAAYASSAALFETAGRFAALVLLRKRLSYDTALGAGLGHGGVESVGLIGVTYLNNIVLSVMANTHTLPDIPALQPAIASLSGADPSLFLAAGAERVFTIFFHMALTAALCLCVMRGRTAAGLAVVFAAHFAFDFFVASLFARLIAVWATEAIMFAIAAASV